MATVIAQHRADLRDALAPVLPGRVHAYPPERSAGAVAPAVWVGDHSYSPGFATTASVGSMTFQVWAVADGSTRAARAQLDDLVGAVADAARVAGWTVDGWAPATYDVDADVTLPAYQLDAVRPVYAQSFCLPVPDLPVTIPATPVPEVSRV